MEENIIYEVENGAPENWDDELILIRDGKGNIFEVDIPDDE